MAQQIGAAFRSLWHDITSHDRHSTIDSPYRTGRHVPLNRDGIDVMTSVATASESRADITSPYHDDHARTSTSMIDTAYGGSGMSPILPQGLSESRPYSPGLRSLSAQRVDSGDGFEMQCPSGEIPMQSLQDGQPPAPPVKHTWNKIDAWAEENYPELFDNLCEGCTSNDLNELEHMLDSSLPQDVRDSLQIHDGQERGGLPTGIVFGAMLLDCEEIVQEWENWRKVKQEILSEMQVVNPSVPSKAFRGISSQASSSKDPARAISKNNLMWRQELLAKQDCVPPHAVQKTYAHAGWIPLVRDWGGNNLAVDLMPGPKGNWGQIIMFGRDYDTKYVVAKSWAHFLAIVAEDLYSGKWFVNEETNELKLREFKKARVEPAYFDILRWREDQKHGRRVLSQKRRSIVAGGAGSPTNAASPYAGPTDGEQRGRSMQRHKNISPLVSPARPVYGKSSPLARVAEETFAPSSLTTNPVNGKARETLVEVTTSRTSGENEKAADKATPLCKGGLKENNEETTVIVNGKQSAEFEEAMKTIEI